MTAAPRWGGLRLEPYDPDADDADGDGIVQEGTAWERPKGTDLLDALGNAIQRGSTATARDPRMKVVRGGREERYTPTYGGQPQGGQRIAGPSKPTPLARAGAPSLRERGMQPLKDSIGTIEPKDEPKPDASAVPEQPRYAQASDVLTQSRPFNIPPQHRGDGDLGADAAREPLVVDQDFEDELDDIDLELRSLADAMGLMDTTSAADPDISQNLVGRNAQGEGLTQLPPAPQNVPRYAVTERGKEVLARIKAVGKQMRSELARILPEELKQQQKDLNARRDRLIAQMPTEAYGRAAARLDELEALGVPDFANWRSQSFGDLFAAARKHDMNLARDVLAISDWKDAERKLMRDINLFQIEVSHYQRLVISKVRGVGKKTKGGKWRHKSSSQADKATLDGVIDAIEDVESDLPTEWLEAIHELGDIDIDHGGRANFSPALRGGSHGMTVSGGGPLSRRSAAAHEMMHVAEHAMPELIAAEALWVFDSIKPGESTSEVHPGEYAYEDEFPNHYIGRMYGNPVTGGILASEALSVTGEIIFGGYGTTIVTALDDDTTDWALGIIAVGGRSRRSGFDVKGLTRRQKERKAKQKRDAMFEGIEMDEKRQPEAKSVASRLHDSWREGRRQPDGSIGPLLRFSDGGIIDIANTPFDELPQEFQDDYMASAMHVISKIDANPDATDEELAAMVHADWLRRNRDWATIDQKRPYERLSEDEKDKSRLVVEEAREALKSSEKPDSKKKPDVDQAESVKGDVRGSVQGRSRTDAEIDAQNTAVIAQIGATGGHWRPSETMTPEERNQWLASETEEGGNPLEYQVETADVRSQYAQHHEDAKDSVRAKIAELEQGDFGSNEALRQQEIARWQEVLDFLESTSPEEVQERLVSIVRASLDDEDTRIAINIPPDILPLIIADGGVYRTTHEVPSRSSDALIRRRYEKVGGVSTSAPAALRPASGYLIFGDKLRAVRDKVRERLGGQAGDAGVADGAWDPLKTALADVELRGATGGSYGGLAVTLKRGVMGRSKFGNGDSFNQSTDPSPTVGATDDEILRALAARTGGKKASSGSLSADQYLPLIRNLMYGQGTELISQSPLDLLGDGRNQVGSNYFEALIYGGFDFADAEKISIDPNTLELTKRDMFPSKAGSGFSQRDLTIADRLQAVVEYMSADGQLDDRLREAARLVEGLPDEELKRRYPLLSGRVTAAEDALVVQKLTRDLKGINPDMEIVVPSRSNPGPDLRKTDEERIDEFAQSLDLIVANRGERPPIESLTGPERDAAEQTARSERFAEMRAEEERRRLAAGGAPAEPRASDIGRVDLDSPDQPLLSQTGARERREIIDSIDVPDIPEEPVAPDPDTITYESDAERTALSAALWDTYKGPEGALKQTMFDEFGDMGGLLEVRYEDVLGREAIWRRYPEDGPDDEEWADAVRRIFMPTLDPDKQQRLEELLAQQSTIDELRELNRKTLAKIEPPAIGDWGGSATITPPELSLDEALPRMRELLDSFDPTIRQALNQRVSVQIAENEGQTIKWRRDSAISQLKSRIADKVRDLKSKQFSFFDRREKSRKRDHVPGRAVAPRPTVDADANLPQEGVVRDVDQINRLADAVLQGGSSLAMPDAETTKEALDFLTQSDIDAVVTRLANPTIDENGYYQFHSENEFGFWSHNGLQALSILGRLRGYDSPALKVSAEELDDAIVDGGMHELRRGGAVAPQEEHISGNMLYGNGVAGGGYYFAVQTYSEEGEAQVRFDAGSYAGEEGRILRAGLNPSARLVTKEKLALAVQNYRAVASGEAATDGTRSDPVDVTDSVEPEYQLAALRQRLQAIVDSGGPESDKAQRAIKNLDALLSADADDGENPHTWGIAAILMGYDGVDSGLSRYPDAAASDNRVLLYNRSAAVVQSTLETKTEHEASVGRAKLAERTRPKREAQGRLPVAPTWEEEQAYVEKVVEQAVSEAKQGLPETASPGTAVDEQAPSVLGDPNAPGGRDNPIDISDWSQIGPQAGSNPGGVFVDEQGNKFYIKLARSSSHAENERLASLLYQLAGIDSVGVLFGEKDGQLYTLSPMRKRAPGTTLRDYLSDEQLLDGIRDGFAVDAWLSNWDVVGDGVDNVIVDENGNPVRVDPGGALMWRARGAAKGDMFGDTVTEVDTLRNSNLNAASAMVFAGATDEQIRAGVERIAKITPDKIDELVDRVVSSPEDRRLLKAKLKSRRQDLMQKYGVPEPSLAVQSDRSRADLDAPDEPLTPTLTPAERSADIMRRFEEAGAVVRPSTLDPDERQALIDASFDQTGHPLKGRFEVSDESPRARLSEAINQHLAELEERLQRLELMLEKDREAQEGGDRMDLLTAEQRANMERGLDAAAEEQAFFERHSAEEIEAMIVKTFQEGLADPDTRVAVQVPVDRIGQLLEEGRSRTIYTGETSTMGTVGHRKGYELAIGMPVDLPDDLRPVSGYVLWGQRRRNVADKAPSWLSAARERFARIRKRELPTKEQVDEAVAVSEAGETAHYGGVRIVLKPEVLARSRFGNGDSLDDGIDPAPMQNPTDDELVVAASGTLIRNAWAEPRRLSELYTILSSGLGDANRGQFDPRAEGTLPLIGIYQEAVIIGGYEVGDIEEMHLPQQVYDPPAEAFLLFNIIEDSGTAEDRAFAASNGRSEVDAYEQAGSDLMEVHDELRLQLSPELEAAIRSGRSEEVGLQLIRRRLSYSEMKALRALAAAKKRREVEARIRKLNPDIKLTFGFDVYSIQTALSAEELQEAGIETVDDYLKKILTDGFGVVEGNAYERSRVLRIVQRLDDEEAEPLGGPVTALPSHILGDFDDIDPSILEYFEEADKPIGSVSSLDEATADSIDARVVELQEEALVEAELAASSLDSARRLQPSQDNVTKKGLTTERKRTPIIGAIFSRRRHDVTQEGQDVINSIVAAGSAARVAMMSDAVTDGAITRRMVEEQRLLEAERRVLATNPTLQKLWGQRAEIGKKMAEIAAQEGVQYWSLTREERHAWVLASPNVSDADKRTYSALVEAAAHEAVLIQRTMQLNAQMREQIRQRLSRMIPMGGTLPDLKMEYPPGVSPEQKARWDQEVQQALQFFPTEWLRLVNGSSNQDPLRIAFVISSDNTGRSYYTRDEHTVYMEITASEFDAPTDHVRGTLIHEIGHAVEERVPGVRLAEHLFLWSRTARDKTDVEFIADEDVFMDGFFNIYAGKIYGQGGYTNSFELLSVALQTLFGYPSRAGSGTMDTEFLDFILGLIMSTGKSTS